MNVLIEFGKGAEDFDDEVYTELLDNLSIENCIVIYNHKNLIGTRKICKYMTKGIYRMPLAEGNYHEAVLQFGEGEPIDNEILSQMAPYENEVMTMLLRWSKRDYTDMWNDYCTHIRFWNHILDTYDIDVFFSPEVVHDGFSYVIYLLCKIKNIAYLSTEKISFPDRLYVVADVNEQLPFFGREYSENLKKYIKNKIDEISLRDDIKEMYDFYTGDKDITPHYMKGVFDKIYIKRFRDIKMRVKFILLLLANLFSFSINVNEIFLKYSFSSFVFREADTFLSYYETKTGKIDYSKKFIYVPLHYQPERTTSPLGGMFVDQVLMVKMLSYYLPDNWLIYVKEHPSMKKVNRGCPRSTHRSKQYYDELASMKNVVLVSMYENTYNLIDNCQAVAVVTGTAGLEAVMRNKQCLMFGYGYLQYAPNVITIRNNKDCASAMYKLQHHIVENNLEKKMKIYFKTLENYFFVGNILWYDAEDRTNYEQDRANSKKSIVGAYLKEIKRIMDDKVLLNK